MTELPAYEHFRRHAAFVPEYADFVLTEGSLRKLLSELDLLWGPTSLGLGDLSLLYHAAVGQPGLAAAAAGRHAATAAAAAAGKPCMTYAATQRLCSILQARAERVRDTFTVSLTAAAAQAAATARATTTARCSTVSQKHSLLDNSHSQKQSRDAHQNVDGTQHQDHAQAHAQQATVQQTAAPTPQQQHAQPQVCSIGAHVDLLLKVITASILPPPLSHSNTIGHSNTLSRSATLKQQASQKSAVTTAGTLYETSFSLPLTHEEALAAAHVGSATQWWDIEPPGRSPARLRPQSSQVQRTLQSHRSLHLSRPRSASGRHDSHSITPGWPHQPAHMSTAFTAAASCDGQIGQLRGANVKVMQAVLRLPVCEFSSVARMLRSIKVLQQAAEASPEEIQSAVKEAVLAWQQALIDKMVKAAAKQRGGGSGVEDAASPSLPCLPAEGTVWLMVVAALTFLTQAQPDIAAQLLDGALDCYRSASLLPGSVINQHHHYGSALQVFKGIIQLAAGRHEDAATTSQQAYKQALLTARISLDPVVVRNAAAAANNQGVALLQLGDWQGAVRCFRAAVQLLRHTPHWGALSMAQELAAATTPSASPTKPPHQSSVAMPSTYVASRAPSPAAAGAAGAVGNGAAADGSDKTASLKSPPNQHTSALVADTMQSGQPPALPLSPTAIDKNSDAVAASIQAPPAKPRRAAAAKVTAPPAPPALGLDAAAAQLAMANLQRALRLSFASGARPASARSVMQAGQLLQHSTSCARRSYDQRASCSSMSVDENFSLYDAVSTQRCRPMTAPSIDLAVSTAVWPHSHDRAVPQMCPVWPETKQPHLREFLTRAVAQQPSQAPVVVPAWAHRATPAEVDGAGKGKGSGKGTGGRKDGKQGTDKAKSPEAYAITWSTDYYDPPIYSVANVKAEAPKVKKVAKKKKGDKKLLPSTSSILRMLPQE